MPRPLTESRPRSGAPAALFNAAIRHHRSGRLAQAEVAYRKVLRWTPAHADALHLLGLIRSERGEHEKACELIGAAVELQPHHAPFRSNLGMALARRGEHSKAILAYCGSLEIDPRNAATILKLARSLEGIGQRKEAVQALREALRLDPNLMEARWLLANALRLAGRLAEAESCYRELIEREPGHWEGQNHLGNLLQMAGRFEEAALHHGDAIRANPECAEAHYNLGIARSALKQWGEAARSFARAVALRPSHADSHFEHGNALHSLGLPAQAAEAYRACLRIDQGRAEANFNLAVSLTETGGINEAAECYRAALRARPGYAEAHNNLAILDQLQGRKDEAEAGYRRAVDLQPAYAQARYNLALTLQEQERLTEARAGYEFLLNTWPEYWEAHNNLGNTLLALGLPSGAMARYRTVLEAAHAGSTAHRQARWNLGIAQLLRGEFEDGWKGFEERLRAPGTRQFSQPPWGGEPFAGRTLLVHAEQGLGDTIQFARFLPAAKERGGDVIFECQPELLDVMRGAGGFHRLVAKGGPLPAFDVQTPLMSLPGIFGASLKAIPPPAPIEVDPERAAYWARRLSNVEPRRGRRWVGLVWAGNPSHKNDRNRSIPVEALAALEPAPGVSFFSLQMGAAIQPCAAFDLTPEIQGIADTAAILMNLDLIVSADTMVAHLAGALGRKVWTLLPFAPDWRWMLGRSDSPWYPSMRLFRQRQAGDWAGVMREVKQALLVS